MPKNFGVKWHIIRDEYVTSSDLPSLDDLAKKHQVSQSAIRHHCGIEHWVEQRNQFVYQVKTKTLERASTTESEIRVRQMQDAKDMRTVARSEFMHRVKEAGNRLPPGVDWTEIRMLWLTGMVQEREAAGITNDNSFMPIELVLALINAVVNVVRLHVTDDKSRVLIATEVEKLLSDGVTKSLPS